MFNLVNSLVAKVDKLEKLASVSYEAQQMVFRTAVYDDLETRQVVPRILIDRNHFFCMESLNRYHLHTAQQLVKHYIQDPASQRIMLPSNLVFRSEVLQEELRDQNMLSSYVAYDVALLKRSRKLIWTKEELDIVLLPLEKHPERWYWISSINKITDNLIFKNTYEKFNKGHIHPMLALIEEWNMACMKGEPLIVDNVDESLDLNAIYMFSDGWTTNYDRVAEKIRELLNSHPIWISIWQTKLLNCVVKTFEHKKCNKDAQKNEKISLYLDQLWTRFLLSIDLDLASPAYLIPLFNSIIHLQITPQFKVDNRSALLEKLHKLDERYPFHTVPWGEKDTIYRHRRRWSFNCGFYSHHKESHFLAIINDIYDLQEWNRLPDGPYFTKPIYFANTGDKCDDIWCFLQVAFPMIFLRTGEPISITEEFVRVPSITDLNHEGTSNEEYGLSEVYSSYSEDSLSSEQDSSSGEENSWCSENSSEKSNDLAVNRKFYSLVGNYVMAMFKFEGTMILAPEELEALYKSKNLDDPRKIIRSALNKFDFFNIPLNLLRGACIPLRDSQLV